MVHDVWSMVFFCINSKIKGWGSDTKGQGSAMVPSFGGPF